MNSREAALSCAQRGWYLLPIAVGAKIPDLNLMPSWGTQSTNDITEVASWFQGNENRPYAIDLGKSDLTVLDFDEGAIPANIGIPDTLQVATGRGVHVYFRGTMPQQKLHFGGKILGDIKSAGGYVLGPYSPHPSGKIYKVAHSPKVLATIDVEWATQKLTQTNKPPIDLSLGGAMIPRGSHDNELHRMAGLLRHMGFEQAGIEQVLMDVAEKRLENPGDDWRDMVKKHAREICKKPIGTQITSYVGSGPIQANSAVPTQANSAVSTQVDSAVTENWLDYFRSAGQLEDGDVKMIINGFLPEGINIIAGPAGQGKTLFALSIAKSLTTGNPFLGKFQPEDIIPVVYMIPESSSRAFKMRCKAFGIPNDPELFLCRTVTEGRTLMLGDPILKEAVKALKPVIILDTLPRFNESGDENDAAGNKKLVDDITVLRELGAIAVIALHHCTKEATRTTPTLENMVRGTGDLGAMCDSVYSIRRDNILYDDNKGPNEIEIRCVKARDYEPMAPFKVAATYRSGDKIISWINESGDFAVIEAGEVIEQQQSQFLKIIIENDKASLEEVAEELGIAKTAVLRMARITGYIRTKGGYGRWMKKSAAPIQPETPPNNG